MIRTIYKFPLEVTDVQQVYGLLEPLTVQVQDGIPCLWGIVDPYVDPSDQVAVIYTYGTGHPIVDRDQTYVGTYQLPGLVFHVFVFIDTEGGKI